MVRVKQSKIVMMSILLMSLIVFSSLHLVYANDTLGNVCGKSISARVEILDTWDNNYRAQIEIANLGTQVINDWFVSFISCDNIYQIWNADIKEHENDTYVIKHVSWKKNIDAGEKVVVEYIASFNEDYDLPHDFISVGIFKELTDSCNIENVSENNGAGIVHGFIEITNNTTDTIEEWKMTCISKCDRIWFTNANIVHRENGQIFVEANTGYEILDPKTSLTIEYYCTFIGEEAPLSNIKLFVSEPYLQNSIFIGDNEKDAEEIGKFGDKRITLDSHPIKIPDVSIASTSYSKANLVSDLDTDYKSEIKAKGDTFIKELLRPNSVEESVDEVLNYDSVIETASKNNKVKKEIIQSILFREIVFLNIADPLADIAVENYFINRELLENYSNLSWWRQLLAGAPNLLYPEREDSSTGLGQILGKTAVKVLNDPSLDPENWKDRKTIWYRLKDDPIYNINMCAKILYNNAGKSLASPTKQQIIDAAALYNRSTVTDGQPYGKRIYTYYTYFKKYNK